MNVYTEASDKNPRTYDCVRSQGILQTKKDYVCMYILLRDI